MVLDFSIFQYNTVSREWWEYNGNDDGYGAYYLVQLSVVDSIYA